MADVNLIRPNLIKRISSFFIDSDPSLGNPFRWKIIWQNIFVWKKSSSC